MWLVVGRVPCVYTSAVLMAKPTWVLQLQSSKPAQNSKITASLVTYTQYKLSPHPLPLSFSLHYNVRLWSGRGEGAVVHQYSKINFTCYFSNDIVSYSVAFKAHTHKAIHDNADCIFSRSLISMDTGIYRFDMNRLYNRP